MPLGIERINVRSRSPNALINFITPLEGPTKAIAQDYLERIAAIVYPIMKENGLAVMSCVTSYNITLQRPLVVLNGTTSLDEFPPNTEFWGRNFNAGDCIQLVLRHPHTGLWLPFKFVEGVMIHELAHNMQMNHSKTFWSVRNGFARILDRLHARNYTGEGFWSAGRSLLSEAYTQDRPLAESDMPKHICGGTYRSHTHRRTRGPSTKKLSYAEQKKRRIERKFGVAGEGKSLAAEHESNGKPTPRVAQSKRGRELRAAAALARLEKQKQEKAEETIDEDTASDTEDEKTVNVGGGKFMVSVSGELDGKEENENMDRELMELIGGACGKGSGNPGESSAQSAKKDPGRSTPTTTKRKIRPQSESGESGPKRSRQEVISLSDFSETDSETDTEKSKATSGNHNTTPSGDSELNLSNPRPSSNGPHKQPPAPPRAQSPWAVRAALNLSAPSVATTAPPVLAETVRDDLQPPPSPKKQGQQPPRSLTCPVCSCTNAADAHTCLACMNVLVLVDSAAAWKCANKSCPPQYRNSRDVAFCGVCGDRRP